jgi:hypothetical protein
MSVLPVDNRSHTPAIPKKIEDSWSHLLDRIWNVIKNLLTGIAKEFGNFDSRNVIDQEAYSLPSEVNTLHPPSYAIEKAMANIFDYNFSELALFKEFYSLVLNSRPDLDPHFEGADFYDAIPTIKKDLELFSHTLATEEERNALKKCCTSLKRAQEIHQAENDDEFELATTMKREISTMPVGSSYVIPGGIGGHSILYEIIRMTQDKYCFTIINTGQDEPWKKRLKHKGRSMGEYLYSDKAYIVEKSKLDNDFLQSILRSSTYNDTMLKLLSDIDKALIARGAQSCDGRIHHPQQRGNCTFKCLNRYVFGNLIDILGKEKGTALYRKFKVFRTEQKWHAIKKLINKLDKTLLKIYFEVDTDQELNDHLVAMSKAYSKVLQKRKRKAKEA